MAQRALEVYGYPEADDWVSFSVARKIIGRSAGWVRGQFNERGISSETRLDKSRHPIEHFGIAVVLEIKEFADTLDAGSMLSIDDIAERVQKSKTSVIHHLAKTNVLPEKGLAGVVDISITIQNRLSKT